MGDDKVTYVGSFTIESEQGKFCPIYIGMSAASGGPFEIIPQECTAGTGECEFEITIETRDKQYVGKHEIYITAYDSPERDANLEGMKH